MMKRFCLSNMITWNAMKIVLKIASPIIVTVILIPVYKILTFPHKDLRAQGRWGVLEQ